ncbi:MAG TPA: AMP-binding protein [Draconibacterium sp.]|nr:AMP-binding protein [Draconibacterium sp.]
MFIPEIEKAGREEITKYQESRLPGLLNYLNENSPFYSSFFVQHNIEIGKIKTLADLAEIPVTTKEMLQKNNMDFLCVDRSKIIDYITTSGTLGEPVTFTMTENDLERLAYNEYISFLCAGGSPTDIYQLMVTMDRRFMAGLAYFSGIRKIGAGVVRVGPGNPELQFDSIRRVQPTSIVTVPSFIIKLIEFAEENKIDLNKTSIKKAICIGEALRNNDFSLNKLGNRIAEKWNIQLFSTYASTEMGTAFTECEYGIGGHHHPEMIIVEFLDDNDKPVKDGEPGEVTITNLGVEGMPLLRFKTGDICNHYYTPCKCGRTTMRLGPVIGRKKQMIKFKGTTLYPPAMCDILNDIKEVKNYVIEVSTNNIGTDDILLKLGVEVPSKELEKMIKDHFRARIRVAPFIQFEKVDEIQKLQFPNLSRKPVTFIDKR